MIPMAMIYLGHDANSVDPDDLAQVEKLLKGVRPYIRYFSSAKMLVDLPNEEVCIAMSWSGDYAQAMYRARRKWAAGRARLHDAAAKGRSAWFDLWFIPADAPHPDNAHLFLNYLLRPKVIADISNEVRYAAPNMPAMPCVVPEVRDDPAVYPPEEVRLSLHNGVLHSPKEERARSRLWSRVKTGL